MPASAASGAAPSIYCDAHRESRQPVLLVHGYNSGPATWNDDTRTRIAHAGYSTCIDVFDYQAYNDRWVTNSHIGPALAVRIDTLAAASKAGGGSGKVIVVAHSNGGLATRCAAAASCNGGRTDVTEHLLELISFGTPNLGSWLVNRGTKGLGDLLSSSCTISVNYWNSLCKELRTLGTSEATRGFTPGSKQLHDLPQLPESVPVYGLAGQVEIYSSFFGLNNTDDGDAGDIIVLEDSATGAAGKVGELGGRQIINCGQIDITDWLRSAHSCTHITETNDSRFLDAATHQIALAEETAAPLSCPTPQQFVSALPASDRALVSHTSFDPTGVSVLQCAGTWAAAGVEFIFPGGFDENGQPAVNTVTVVEHYVAGRWAKLKRDEACGSGQVPEKIYPLACLSN